MKRSRVAVVVLALLAAFAGQLALWFAAPLFMLGCFVGMIAGGIADALDYGGRWRPALERWLRGERKAGPT